MKTKQYSETSEKALERYLVKRAKESGGIALKYYNPLATGYPDRLLLFPFGTVGWAEVKTSGKHPSPLQSHRMALLREQGFPVWVVDSREKADAVVAEMSRRSEKRRRHGEADV